MSNIQYAFVRRDYVPTLLELQASIDALGFDLKLHPEYSPFKDSGFLPFVLNGEEGPGFEIQYVTAAELIDGDEAMKTIAAGRDYCISMAWRGSMKDLACVLIVSCALMKDFDCIVSYEGEPPEPYENLLATVREVLEETTSEGVYHSNHPIIQERRPWWKFW